MSDKNEIKTYSQYFLDCLRASSFAVEGANIESICTRGVYTESSYTKGIVAIKHPEIHLQSF